MAYYIGLDIGGTKCACSLGEFRENALAENLPVILKKEQFPTANFPPLEILSRFKAFIESVISDYKIEGIGISCGGPLDSKLGIIQAPPSLPLWDNIEIVKYFEDAFKIKTRLQNDANACAVAEWLFGAGKSTENMIFLTFGTGLGAGLILNGKLYSGTNDNAGEIGHVRLTKSGPLGYFKNGSCEGYCSGSGIKRLAEQMSKNAKYKDSYSAFVKTLSSNEINAKNIAENARLGNEFCLAVYKKSGEMLGRTLSILIDILNPEAIVIGGVFMRSNDLLLPHATKILKKESLPFALNVTKILPAKLSENVGDLAALAVATGRF